MKQYYENFLFLNVLRLNYQVTIAYLQANFSIVTAVCCHEFHRKNQRNLQNWGLKGVCD